jgi:transketolase
MPVGAWGWGSREPGTVYCLASDGEMQVGTTWESALIAAKLNLPNLVLVVDRNRLQAMGGTEDVLPLGNLAKKFESFGWDAVTVDGHDHGELSSALSWAADQGGPCAIIAETTKGKGVSFMEGNNLYHYKALSDDELVTATEEIVRNLS